MPQPPRRRRRGPQWQQDVDTEDETGIIEEWALHLDGKDFRVGRWRQAYQARKGVVHLSDFKQCEKRPGALLLLEKSAQWFLYFYEDSLSI